MNWDSHSWKTLPKVLLGIATIWPIVYMGLFVVFAFSMVLILPFAEKGSRNCGNVDLLQLDRKIKNGEIKQLIVRPRTIVAADRIGDCQFEIVLTNQATREEILSQAREIVNGRARVENIEEQTADQPDLPTLAPLGFVGFFVVHMLSVVLMLALMPLYIILAVKNETLDQTMRIVWVVLLCTMGILVNPVYWYLYIWRKPPGIPTKGDAAQPPGVDIPTVS